MRQTTRHDPLLEMPTDIRQGYLSARNAGPLSGRLRVLSRDELDPPIGVPQGEDESNPPDGLDGFGGGDASPDSQPPLVSEDYFILSEISSGGQATVYQALQRSTGQTVAIKVLAGGGLVGARRRARFDREARILAALDHPNVVRIVDRGRTTDGSLFIVMRFVRGPTLDEYLYAGGYDRDLTLSVFETICQAVGEAHAMGFVHRDLKPSNIRVDRWGDPHVLDFGLARVMDEDAQERAEARELTTTGQVLGSMPWTSPEQASGSRDVGPSSDVYALGVMLYECLAGSPPYDVSGTVPQTILEICTARPKRPSAVRSRPRATIWRLWAEPPDPLDAVVLKALAKDPGQRYADAAELGRELAACRAGNVKDSGWPRRLRRLPRFSPVAAGVILCLAILVASAFAGNWARVARGQHAGSDGRFLSGSPAAPPATEQIRPQPAFTNSVGMELVRLKDGWFVMGSPLDERGRRDEEVPHLVHLSRPFYLSATPVTQDQYEAVIGSNPSDPSTLDPDFPVNRVTYSDALKFCRVLSKKEGRAYRLPTEAEWEYACRAGTNGPYAGDLNAIGTYVSNSYGRLQRVRQKQPNAWGLYDMHGLVHEWCQDWFGPYRLDAPNDPIGGPPSHHRITRGGAFNSEPDQVRSADRGPRDPDLAQRTIGFRVVCDATWPP